MSTQPPDDPVLIERARRDPEAFAVLYRRYLVPVYRYLYRRLDNVHDSEDLTAQVFMDALEDLARGRFQSGGNFAAWLFTIARHRIADFYRRKPAAVLDELPSGEAGLLAAVEKADDLKHLARLLSQLDTEKQELLRLRFSGGLGFAEIALLEGKSEAAVKMNIYRAIDWLRDHWEAENE
jgi:RNA polymerase sigma-70 factor (ECF subfamily)